MSAKTDELMNQMKGYYVNGGHGSVVKLGDTGLGLICNQIADEIAELEAERDAWNATAERIAEWLSKHHTETIIKCILCESWGKPDCLVPCPTIDVQYILAHFGAPEEV